MFFNSKSFTKILLFHLVVVCSYTFFVFHKDSKRHSFFKVSNNQVVHFSKTKPTVLFLCSFDLNSSLQNLHNLNKVHLTFKNSNLDVDFFYVFALKDLSVSYFSYINAIMLSNKLQEENCLYLDLTGANNFLSDNSLSTFPILVLINENGKVIYKNEGYITSEEVVFAICEKIKK